MQRALVDAGWDVTEAENGRVALEALEEGPPDLVVLDLIMPEMDGFEFLDELRSREGGYGIPVLVVTAKDLTAEDRARLGGYITTVFKKDEVGEEDFLAELTRQVREVSDHGCPRAPASRDRRGGPYSRCGSRRRENGRHEQDTAGGGQRDEPGHALPAAVPEGL